MLKLKGKACFLMAASIAVLLTTATLNHWRTSSSNCGLPQIILWAWERPEKLDFINPREVGVAYLARTIYLRGEKVITRPRFQPLSVPRETALIAVVRIESDSNELPALSDTQREEAVRAIKEAARRDGVMALQVDFDAKQSERAFYRALLFDLRRQLPQNISLTITALASWCIYDNWLRDLPIDDAVPMLFRLGVDERQVSAYLSQTGALRARECQQSLGISTDEPRRSLPTGRRVYLFSPQPWTQTSANKIIREVKAWP